jgi:prolyl oligopeptidase PreP (S9A serine peptidase family)
MILSFNDFLNENLNKELQKTKNLLKATKQESNDFAENYNLSNKSKEIQDLFPIFNLQNEDIKLTTKVILEKNKFTILLANDNTNYYEISFYINNDSSNLFNISRIDTNDQLLDEDIQNLCSLVTKCFLAINEEIYKDKALQIILNFFTDNAVDGMNTKQVRKRL